MLDPVIAAKLILADYEGTLDAELSLDIKGCQCTLIAKPGEPQVLLIRGSDERLDWMRNFRFLPDMTPGDSMRLWWHRGFLEHAEIAWTFAKDKGVEVVIGHSLGAACVQIVATSLGVPGVAFASPRPLWAPAQASPRPANEQLVVNHCRSDDTVCYLPPEGAGFSHVGEVKWYTPDQRQWGEDHRIRHLIPMLEAAAEAAG